MNILSITAQKPHSTGSGVFLTELVRGFDRLGAKQAVLAGICRGDTTDFPQGIQFYPVYFQSEALPFAITGMSDEMPYASTRYCDLTPSMLAQFREAFSARLLEAAQQFHPDLVICHHLYLLTALARDVLPHTRMIAICHGSDLRQLRKNPLCRTEIIEKIKTLDAIWALHETQRESILQLFGCPEEKVNVLGTGFNNRIFSLQETAHFAAPDAPVVRLLFAGKLSEKKGVMSLLAALSLLPASLNLSLTLAGGSGNEAETEVIRRLAASCPFPVSFAGRLSQTALAAEMNRADIFVLPSFYEGLPLVLMEAMACGMRCICTDLPGIKDWLCHYVPHHTVTFVAPPDMANTDEPLPEALPAFEARLAESIYRLCVSSNAKCTEQANSAACAISHSQNSAFSSHTISAPLCAELSALSWDGLCKKLLEKERIFH